MFAVAVMDLVELDTILKVVSAGALAVLFGPRLWEKMPAIRRKVADATGPVDNRDAVAEAMCVLRDRIEVLPDAEQKPFMDSLIALTPLCILTPPKV